jgi:rhodanese-related sulfurtransferase
LQGLEFYNPAPSHPGLAGSRTTVTFLLENWHLVLAAVVSGGLLLWPMITGGTLGGAVNTGEAVRLINREKAVLIDVGDAAEYAAGHAAGARSVPLATLESSKALPTNKALPLVVMCPSGNRASKAVGLLKKLGYPNAQALAGGLAAWREANLPIEKSA